MAQDVRESRSPVSGVAKVQPTNDVFNTVLELRDSETLAPDYLKVHYAGGATAETVIDIHDRNEDFNGADDGDMVDSVTLSPGDDIVITDATYDDISSGLQARADGNNDGLIVVTAGGLKTTS